MITLDTTADLPPIVGHVKAYREPDEVCESCRKFWEQRGKDPRILVELEQRTDYGHKIYLCPHCDGDTLKFALQQRNS